MLSEFQQFPIKIKSFSSLNASFKNSYNVHNTLNEVSRERKCGKYPQMGNIQNYHFIESLSIDVCQGTQSEMNERFVIEKCVQLPRDLLQQLMRWNYIYSVFVSSKASMTYRQKNHYKLSRISNNIKLKTCKLFVSVKCFLRDNPKTADISEAITFSANVRIYFYLYMFILTIQSASCYCYDSFTEMFPYLFIFGR